MARHGRLGTPGRRLIAVLTVPLLGLLTVAAIERAPSARGATSTSASWSVPERDRAIIAAQPAGIVADTAWVNGLDPVPDAGDLLTGMSSAGNVNWRVPYVSGDYTPYLPVSDNGGNTFYGGGTLTAPGKPIVAVHGDSQVWSLDAPAGSMTVGPDGNLYDIVGSTLYGYRAADHQLLFAPATLASNDGTTGFSQIFAYDKGLVVANGLTVAFVNLSGQITGGPYQINSDFAITGAASIAVSASGDVFGAWASVLEPGISCEASGGQSLTVSKITPAGPSWVQKDSAAIGCGDSPLVAATPDGGALVGAQASSGAGLVVRIDAQGTFLPSITIQPPTTASGTAVETPAVDMNGEIVVAQDFQFDCQLDSDRCSGVQVDRFAPDGSRIDGSLLQGPVGSNQETWYLSGTDAGDGIALTPGAAALSLTHSSSGVNYGSLSFSVSGFSMPGLAAEYPQGALWTLMPTAPQDPLTLSSINIIATDRDPLLKRQASFTLATPGVTVARYEFGWASKAHGSTVGTVQRCSVGATKCWLDYRPTDPSTTWNLLARAVDTTGRKGRWLAQPIKVPSKFILLVGGDSIPAGHHRDSEGVPTTCEDAQYSFGQTIWTNLEASVPPQWRDETFGYINVAKSGFGTSQMLFGGKDACGAFYGPEVDPAVDVLKQHAGSWNVVVWDGGINNTNWGGVLGNIIKANALGNVKTAKQCAAYTAKWDFQDSSGIPQEVKTDVTNITSQLSTADPLAKRFWTSYYNAAGTGALALMIPGVCKSPFNDGLKILEGTVRPITDSSGFQWVNVNAILGGRDDLLQDIYPSDIVFKTSGWPHPNHTGAAAIGREVLQHT